MRKPRADLEQQLEKYRHELAEAREHLAEAQEQQSATSEILTVTSEVLQVISSSHGELEPIFQQMLINATRICDAKFGILYEFAKGQFRAISWMGVPPAFAGGYAQIDPEGKLVSSGEAGPMGTMFG